MILSDWHVFQIGKVSFNLAISLNLLAHTNLSQIPMLKIWQRGLDALTRQAVR